MRATGKRSIYGASTLLHLICGFPVLGRPMIAAARKFFSSKYGRRHNTQCRENEARPPGRAAISDRGQIPWIAEAGKRYCADLLLSDGTALCRRNLLNRQFKPTAVRLRLKGSNWHWLRHATASLLDAAGLPSARCRLCSAYLVRGDAGALHSRGLLEVAKCGVGSNNWRLDSNDPNRAGAKKPKTLAS
jgi:hypothetical protein